MGCIQTKYQQSNSPVHHLTQASDQQLGVETTQALAHSSSLNPCGSDRLEELEQIAMDIQNFLDQLTCSRLPLGEHFQMFVSESHQLKNQVVNSISHDSVHSPTHYRQQFRELQLRYQDVSKQAFNQYNQMCIANYPVTKPSALPSSCSSS